MLWKYLENKKFLSHFFLTDLPWPPLSCLDSVKKFKSCLLMVPKRTSGFHNRQNLWGSDWQKLLVSGP